ncbi:cupin domain-containing protein [Microbacterium sp. NPDC028030]|uniref:cupin domain-containing protein n=1 Tax=Microbacterium sp. NPDC028030 TaxID=3155124 RepID=UPI0033C1F4AD
MTNPQNPVIKPTDRETEVVPWGTNKLLISEQTHPDSQLTVIETVVLPGHSHSWHVHERSDEVLYVISGDGYATVGEGNRVPVTRGDYIRIPRGTYHDTHNKGWAPLHMLVFYGPGLEIAPRDEDLGFPRAFLPAAAPVQWETSFEPGDPEFTVTHTE